MERAGFDLFVDELSANQPVVGQFTDGHVGCRMGFKVLNSRTPVYRALGHIGGSCNILTADVVSRFAENASIGVNSTLSDS